MSESAFDEKGKTRYENRSDFMSKKNTVKKTAAIVLALAATLGATGCNFIVTDSEKDLAQSVATVNISAHLKQDKNDALKNYADDVQELINKNYLSNTIPKRDLVASFLTQGAVYVQNYGYTYADTFNMLMDGLVNQKLLTQYAVAYKLSTGTVTLQGCKDYVDAELAEANQSADKTLYKLYDNNREYLAMKYFLTAGKEDAESMRSYNEAEYSLRYSINNSLDSAESGYITVDEDTHSHATTRTTPTNANTKETEYYPISGAEINYHIYTGRNDVEDCGEYEALDGSTKTTRKKAYNAFLSNLQGYGLVKEDENTADVTKLDYYYMELSNILGQMLVSEYAEDLEEKAIQNFTSAEAIAEYERIYNGQKAAYEASATSFDTALDSVSDSSFVLYGLENFGFVYNILLPFSASQNLDYTTAKNKFGSNQEAIYKARRDILSDIQATDLREAWFCADNEDEHYAYKTTEYYGAAAETPEEKYVFFENTKTDKQDEYKSLTQYYGKYAYNGTVEEKDGEYTFTPNKIDVDEFIDIFEGYIEFASGKTASGAKNAVYSDDSLYINVDTKKTNYEKFIYYSGKVNLANTNPKDYFYKGSVETEDFNDSYAALSAVNELMFAYSTDTGCLNSYMGYAVAPDKTDFVSEFEYAAQQAVLGGVGSYVVVPSDFGWHIIYCSFAYNKKVTVGEGETATEEYDAKVYGDYLDEEKDKVGTFSNLFYESMKTKAATNAATNMQNKVLNNYKNSATRHTAAYQDLLDLDK